MTNLEYIEVLFKSDLTQYQTLSNLYSMLKIYEKENFKHSHIINKKLKFYTVRALADKTKSVDELKKLYTLHKLEYLFDAPHEFESYLIYLEWDREPEKRFYIPRRKQFRQIVKYMQMLEDDELDMLSISLPPGVGKTTLGCFFLSWVMGRHPEVCNLASAHGDKLTRGFYDQVGAILTDPEYLFRDVFPTVKVQAFNSKDETINLNKAKRFKTLTCRSIGGGLTGATRCEGYLYCDDLVSGIEEALNIERLDSLWSKYTNDLKSRKKKKCKEIHIATRWSVHDVIGRIERMYADSSRAIFIAVPALDERDESNFDYNYNVGFDTKFYRDMRDNLDDISWRCLYMNEPIEREGLLFPPDELKYFNGNLPEGDLTKIVAFCDVAWGGGDYLSMPFAFVYGSDAYIVDVAFSDKDKSVTRTIVVGKCLANKPTQVRFEANNGGDEYADKVDDILRNQYNFRTSITHRKAPNTKSKLAKIIQAAPDIKEHCYFLDKAHRTAEYSKFMKQLTEFNVSGSNKHDDAPDSMAGLTDMIFKNYGVVKVIDRPF